jgi:hypothetical protein
MNILTYRIRLRKLESKLSIESKALDKVIESDKKKGISENVAYQSNSFEYRIAGEKIDILKSDYLISTANKLSLRPRDQNKQNEDYWERDSEYGKPYLSEKGYCDLRSAIRKERKESQEIVIPIITVLIGIFGTLIGLLTVAKSYFK